MKCSDKPLSQTVVQLCLAKGIDHVVISPGSRNAPLTIGFTEYGAFTTYSIVDERCAGFFGLGLAQQLQRPVALVCTSGSALLNYYPAIAEAYYSNIPLVVLSADRPPEFIDIGDGQTIRQKDVFKNHILYSGQCAEGEEQQLQNEKEINIALNTAIELSGPVHLNIPFTEPLYGRLDDPVVRPQHVPARKTGFALSESLEPFVSKWNQSSKKLILLGVLPPASLPQTLVDAWAADPSVLVLTETTSNVHHTSFIANIDQLITALSEEEKEHFQPDLLITMGGMIVSKRIKALLRSYNTLDHWYIGTDKANDTFFQLKHHFKCDLRVFWENFLPKSKEVSSEYQRQWLQLSAARQKRHDVFMDDAPYSDLAVFGRVFETLPHAIDLHLANSTPIRYAQLFNMDPSWHVYCNRGTSGIDGSTSTAIGNAVASKRPAVLITGDLSFFYDSNALWNNYTPKNFRVILINNQGGGIFRILPNAKSVAHFDTYFETQHQLQAAPIAKLYGWNYYCATTIEDVEAKLAKVLAPSEQPALLEIQTPSAQNDEVLARYFDALY